MIRRFARFVALLAAALAVPVAAADDAASWLPRLRHALDTLQYEGVFVYLHDGQVDSMQVRRTVNERGTREHLVSLTGDRRQLLREGNSVQFLLPAGLMTLTSGGDGAMPPEISGDAPYELVVSGQSRVAGYEAAILDAKPRDTQRYGYRLWIERETGMLLGSALVGADGNAIEQMMFTSLVLKPGPAVAAATPAPAAVPAPVPGEWSAPALPDGFRLVARPAAERDAEHQVWSDGLANVSLYVEPLRAETADWTGSSRRGAIAVVGRVRGGYHVVVMGDLPVATVERIADSVQPRGPN